MPIAVITRLLGIPDADSEEFERYGQAFGSALGGLQSLRHARELGEAQRRLQRIFGDLIELRRADPGDDVISRLATAPGEQIHADDIVPLCTLLLIAGFETTVNLIGNTVATVASVGPAEAVEQIRAALGSAAPPPCWSRPTRPRSARPTSRTSWRWWCATAPTTWCCWATTPPTPATSRWRSGSPTSSGSPW